MSGTGSGLAIPIECLIEVWQEPKHMTQSEAEPMFPIPAVYLIRDKGESPEGPVKKLQAGLEQHWPGLNFIRPDIPVYDPKRPADVAAKELLRTPI
jgi:hypothetical protein